MKLLITGGAGFIGSNFIHYWIKKYPNDEIVCLDSLTYCGRRKSLKDLKNNKKFVFKYGDITNSPQVEYFVKNCDLVVHFAAETHVDRSIKTPEIFLQTNVMGTFNILEAVKKHSKKMIHISTDEVFGQIQSGEDWKFDEHTRYDPRSPYSASKASSDHLVRSYISTYGIDAKITNCSNNYGPYQFPEKFIARAITDVIDGKKIKVYGEGKQLRDWLYVEDHCRAIDKVIKKGKTGQTYLIGGEDLDMDNKSIAQLILYLMGKDDKEIEYVEDRKGHDFKYAIDWSKINKELKWSPKYHLVTGLKKTIEWYKNNEWWWRPIKEEAEALYK